MTSTLSADHDLLLPFQLDQSYLRGRIVRLDRTLNTILSKHKYPESVSYVMSEAVTLASLLAGMLKYEGIFTLQVKGDGPLSLLVVDITSQGNVRGYAKFDEKHLGDFQGRHTLIPRLFGKGYLAFTVDQGEHTERYQGIVELTGETLTDCVQHYFRQSEQLATGIMVAVGFSSENTNIVWKSTGLMLQKMPSEGGLVSPVSLPTDAEDDWRRAMVLMATCSSSELLNPHLSMQDLLYRLFHEEGVRVYPPHPIQHGCRCSRARVSEVLASLSQEDRQHLVVDGKASVTCEFCNASYVFTIDDIEKLPLNNP